MIPRMPKHKNIFIIGPLGAGKTTIGRQIAKKARMVFYDSDLEIENKTGVSVATVFEYEGETGFRQREESVIAQLTQLDNIVLSSGGGAILSEQNREAFANRGIVIYLSASIESQLARTNQRKGVRPLLDIPDPLPIIIEFDRIRGPLYASIADLTYSTDDQPPHTIADQVLQDIEVLLKNQ